jgi:SAM-dependent methyltransferase
MPDHADVDLEALSDLCTPWCIRVVVTLRVAEHIANGASRIEDLAEAAECDADALARVLQHLIGKGVFEEPAPGRFALNKAAQALTGPSVRIGFDLDGIGGRMAYPWSTLLTAVRTGQPAFREVFGKPFWEDLDANPNVAARFDELMGPLGHGSPDPEVLMNGDWDAVHAVVDVGGGTGAMLAEILRAHPAVTGTLVDLPRTVARSADVFAAAGVADRATTHAQSFFDPLPAGADLYLLKNLLADWPDTEAQALLSRCAEAARPSGRVVVLGGVSPDDDRGARSELLMLVLVGGKSRTLSEFRELARGAGLEISVTGNQPSGRFVVECRLVSNVR